VENKSNIYEKLQKIREELQTTKLPKTGKNKYAGYDYFTLDDFLPTLIKLMSKAKITSVISFHKEIASLQLINAENIEEKITFTSPMATTDLKGCHDIQNLGAVQTYLRRYLYITAFDITEEETLDLIHNPNSKTPKAPSKFEEAVILIKKAKTRKEIEGIYSMFKHKVLEKEKDKLTKVCVDAVDEIEKGENNGN
jgi:hypothetical protein